MAKTKRGYNTEFKAHGNTGKDYLLDNVPAGFWARVKAKAKTEGLSIRGLILTLLKLWLETDGIQFAVKATQEKEQ